MDGLTDSQGRIVDFKNTVIIMTSNLGAQHISRTERGLGIRGEIERRGADEEKANEATRNRVMDEVKKAFRPEFLNRIDEVIVFDPLSPDQIFQIVDLMLTRVNKQIKTQELTLEVTPEVKEVLANGRLRQDDGRATSAPRGSAPDRRPAGRRGAARHVPTWRYHSGVPWTKTKRSCSSTSPLTRACRKRWNGEIGEPDTDTNLPPYEEPATIG